MKNSMWKMVGTMCFLVFLTGCATVRIHKDYALDEYVHQPKKIAIIKPNFKLYELKAGGVSELMDEWVEQSQNVFMDALQQKFKEYPQWDAELVPIDYKEALGDLKGDWAAVSGAIYNFMSNDKLKRNDFDYSLKKSLSLMRDKGYDAVVLGEGFTYLWTGGRIALAVFAQIAGYSIKEEYEYIYFTILDTHTGDVVWSNILGEPGDLRNATVAVNDVKRIFKDFNKYAVPILNDEETDGSKSVVKNFA